MNTPIPPLPPGMVLEPSGTGDHPHHRPKSSHQEAQHQPQQQQLFILSGDGNRLATTAAISVHDDDARALPARPEALGRAIWTFLHSIVTYDPGRPSSAQRAHLLQLLHAFPTLYLCGHCVGGLGRTCGAARRTCVAL